MQLNWIFEILKWSKKSLKIELGRGLFLFASYGKNYIEFTMPFALDACKFTTRSKIFLKVGTTETAYQR